VSRKGAKGRFKGFFWWLPLVYLVKLSKHGEKIMTILKRITTALVLIIFISLSIYTIWGWLTMQDIRSYCAREGLDTEQVLYLLAQASYDFTATTMERGKKVDSGDISLTESVKIPSYIARLYIMRVFKNHKTKFNPENSSLLEDEESTIVVTPLDTFLYASENVSNLICCFGIGYMMGILVVGVEFIRGIKISSMRLIFRPLVGALASFLLLIVIISGGSVIWNQVAGVKGLSLGMIGVIGSLFCEKIKPLLTTSV